MRVVCNSDVIWQGGLMSRLQESIALLGETCSKLGHVIVIPETTLLEFERSQNDAQQNASKKLESAYRLLDRAGIDHEIKAASEVYPLPDLVGLLKATGAEVELEIPTFDDFKEAHRTACGHLAPQPPETKNDEMRDLIIWTVAIRLARQDGEAVLLSRDTVHTHSRGDEEASSVGLTRVRGVDEVLAWFGVETPAGGLFRSLLLQFRSALVNSNLGVQDPLEILGISDARFRQGRRGPEQASATVFFATNMGSLRANTEIVIDSARLGTVRLADITVDGKPHEPNEVELSVDLSESSGDDDYGERLDALREVLES